MTQFYACSADTFYHNSFTKDFRVHVRHDGRITWAFGGIFATICELDMTYYPFDRQSCKIEIENWAYDGHHVNLSYVHDYVMLDGYHESGVWVLEKTSLQRKDLYFEVCMCNAVFRMMLETRKCELSYGKYHSRYWLTIDT